MDRQAPHSLEAERAVLGSILLDNDTYLEIAETVVPEDFYVPAHQLIFKAMRDLVDRNRAIDLVTLRELLRDRGELDKAGGPLALTELMEDVPTAAHAANYARTVREKAMVRHMVGVSTQIVEEGYGAIEKVEDYIDRAEERVLEVNARQLGSGLVSSSDVVKATIARIEKLYDQKASITGLATGFHDLDMKTAGLQPGNLVVIAARPGMGKTSLALSMARNASVIGRKKVAFYSMEMSAEELMTRLLCMQAPVEGERLKTGKLTETDWNKVITAAGALNEAPLWIDDSGTLTLTDLRAKSRRLAKRHGLDLVVVDYLQLMSSPPGKGTPNREAQISEISRGLKRLAKELAVPVIAMAQLNRGLEGREDKRPRLSDLRESGAIEQDADIVLFIYRDEKYNESAENRGLAEILMGKHRAGPTGTIEVLFQHEYTRFVSIKREE